MIDVTTTFAVISWKKEAYRIMIADKIKNARTILYYITTICVALIIGQPLGYALFSYLFFLPHTIAKRNGKIRYFIPIPDRYNPQYKMIFFFSGCFCDILIRSRIRPERKYYVT